MFSPKNGARFTLWESLWTRQIVAFNNLLTGGFARDVMYDTQTRTSCPSDIVVPVIDKQCFGRTGSQILDHVIVDLGVGFVRLDVS